MGNKKQDLTANGLLRYLFSVHIILFRAVLPGSYPRISIPAKKLKTRLER